MKAYRINSPKCGRDKNGVFHCACGKCCVIGSAAESENSCNGSNDSRDRRNGCQDGVYKKPLPVSTLP